MQLWFGLANRGDETGKLSLFNKGNEVMYNFCFRNKMSKFANLTNCTEDFHLLGFASLVHRPTLSERQGVLLGLVGC